MAEARTGGGKGARAAHLASMSSTLPGVKNNEEAGDVDPSSAGPQQKLGPGSSSALASTQPMPMCRLLLLSALLGQRRTKDSALTNKIVDLAVPAGSPSANIDAVARETEPMTAAGAWKAEADLSTARTCRVGTHRCVSEVYWAQWQA